MRSVLRRLLEKLGLVTVRRYSTVVHRLQDAEKQVKKLSRLAHEGRQNGAQLAKATTQLEALRAELLAWKQKAHEGKERITAADRELRLRSKELEVARRQMADTVKKPPRPDAEVAKLRERLTEAERELLLAREHLMTIEVKLDILEGAANVLDSRMRTATVRRDTQITTPV